jgi:transposase
MTDDEWAYFEPFLIHHGGGRPPRNHRRVLDAVFWLMRTGAPWRDLPEGFGNWNSIFRQFRRCRWTIVYATISTKRNRC